MENKDLEYMKMAYEEALVAYKNKEVPVGCVIVYNDEVIAKAHNMRHNKKCSLYHAEILAIKEASKKLDRWILSDCTLYVTLEPCLMCTGAIIQSRIKRVVYGIDEDRFGCIHDAFNIFKEKQNHQVELEKGLLTKEISELMTKFFKEIREDKK